jgi:hypothetical protein
MINCDMDFLTFQFWLSKLFHLETSFIQWIKFAKVIKPKAFIGKVIDIECDL